MNKKLISALLICSIGLGLVGCGGQGEQAVNTGGEKVKKEEVSQEDGEIPTITWGVLGENYEESERWPNDIFKEIQAHLREELNVNLELVGYPDSQNFELTLASGELPDVVSVNLNYVSALLKGNHMIPMDDYLEFAPDLVNLSEVRLEAMRKYYSKDNDGKFYFWTPYIGIEPAGKAWWNGLNIRWDYYKELGYPEVANEDEFLQVVKQAVEKHPQTEDGKKVYGVATYSDSSLWGWWVRGAMYGYKNITDAYMLDYRDGKNEIISNLMDLDSPTWRDIRYYYKANQLGIFDPDSFTMSGDDLKAKSSNGQLVSVNCTWYEGSLRENELAKNPDSLAQYMVLPMEGQYNWGRANTEIGWTFYTGITKNCENPEAAMKIFNFLNTDEGSRMIFMGAPGERWDITDNKASVTQKALDIRAKGGNESSLFLGGLWSGFVGPSAATVCEDGGYTNLWQAEEVLQGTLTQAEKDFSKHYGVDIPVQATDVLITEGKAWDSSIMDADMCSLLPPTPQDISRIDSRCVEIMIKAIPRLVLAKDQAEFDKVQAETLKTMEDAGIQKSIDWWKAQEKEISTFLDSVRNGTN